MAPRRMLHESKFPSKRFLTNENQVCEHVKKGIGAGQSPETAIVLRGMAGARLPFSLALSRARARGTPAHARAWCFSSLCRAHVETARGLPMQASLQRRAGR